MKREAVIRIILEQAKAITKPLVSNLEYDVTSNGLVVFHLAGCTT